MQIIIFICSIVSALGHWEREQSLNVNKQRFHETFEHKLETSRIRRAAPATTTRPIDKTQSRINADNVMLTALGMQECGRNVEGDKIIAGTEATQNQFCYMALLYYGKTSNSVVPGCGGTLIQSRVVLTAGHCVKDLPYNMKMFFVRLGEHNTNSNPDCWGTNCSPAMQQISVLSTHYHQDFNASSLVKDLGLVILAQAAYLNYDSICLACLPVGDLQFAPLNGVTLTVSGWGVTESGYSSKVLMAAIVPYANLTTCANSLVTKDECLFCAGGGAKDSCTGDSGGPITAVAMYKLVQPDGTYIPEYRYVVVGVVSYGPSPCGIKGKYGIYTQVGCFTPWILDTIYNKVGIKSG